ncbi:helix-turn-helix transcriptional regulator [Saccharibacillus alkalitolerans]|uniref:YafY family transcriptional regulator n=1 Tax=Saccharibacillus alkalitolerans TaxID=2705290 RepID=A0ABX0EZQ8_9BACL|nr:YafY family protein [Saccharibacillus alkalitolerans]NGZ74131.1 YafY family transcriptional regulator [Saccharibacillus alkalitolerans]
MRGDRLLKIMLLLQGRGRMSTRELAEELEVTPRTVSRDLEALGQSGIPIVAHRGRFGGWSLMEGYRSGLTGMTPDETSTLLLRASSGPLRDIGLEEHYEAALRKLKAAYPGPGRQGAEFLRRKLLIDESGWHGGGSEVPEALAVCQEAVWEERKLRFEYAKERGGEASERIVEPLGLVVKRGVWYLAARERKAVKTFRISKMTRARRLDDLFGYPEAFDLSAYWEEFLRLFPKALPRYEAELTMGEAALEAFRAERYIRVLRAERLQNGDYDVSADLATPEFALRFVLGFGTAVRITGPEDLAEAVSAEAGRVARMYGRDISINEEKRGKA